VTPDPVVSDVSRCGPGSVNFTSGSLANLQWFDSPGGNVLGAGDNFVTTVLNNNTTFWVIAGDVCPSNIIPIIAYINPLPVINLGNDTLIASGNFVVIDAGTGFTNYLWSTQETTQSIAVNTAGMYSVVVMDANGCQGSDDINVNISTEISSISDEGIAIFPNPAKDICNLYLPSVSSTWNIRLTDATGKILFRREVKSGLNEIEVQDYSSGIYYLNIRSKDSTKTIKLFVD
jgi:hypothetical protein